MIEFSGEQISNNEDIQRFAVLLARHHQVPAEKVNELRRNKFRKGFFEETRYFQCIAGKESTIYYHYDVSTWIVNDTIQMRVDAIAFYYSFQDALEAASNQGLTLHHFSPAQSTAESK